MRAGPWHATSTRCVMCLKSCRQRLPSTKCSSRGTARRGQARTQGDTATRHHGHHSAVGAAAVGQPAREVALVRGLQGAQGDNWGWVQGTSYTRHALAAGTWQTDAEHSGGECGEARSQMACPGTEGVLTFTKSTS